MEFENREAIFRLEQERLSTEKIDTVINQQKEVAKWLMSPEGPLKAYQDYQEALKNPITRNLGEAREKILENFPQPKFTFNLDAPTLDVALKDRFNSFCAKYDITVSLDEYASQLNNFLSQKGTGEIGLFKLYDTINITWSALEKFKTFLHTQSMRRQGIMPAYQEEVPWTKIKTPPIRSKARKKKRL